MKRKHREAMRTANRVRDMEFDDPADALQQYEEMARRRMLWPPMPVKPASTEPWRPLMTEQECQQHEQYVRENNLPF